MATGTNVSRGTPEYHNKSTIREMFHVKHVASAFRVCYFPSIWGKFGPHHCGCKPKGRSRQDNHRGEFSRLSRHRRTTHFARRLRFPSQCDGGDWLLERSFAKD